MNLKAIDEFESLGVLGGYEIQGDLLSNSTPPPGGGGGAREFFIANLLVRIQFIIGMIRRTDLAPWESESPFPGGLTSTCLDETPNTLTRGGEQSCTILF